MSEATVKQIDELVAYSGPNSIPSIKFRPAAKAMGVTAWGMSVLDLAPGCVDYPEHDHVKDGQEEVYVVLAGSATLIAGGVEQPVAVGAMVRVPPDLKRKFVAGADGVRLLAIGATPGQAFAPRT